MIFALATVCAALIALVVLAFFLGTEALSALSLILLAVLIIANWIANL
jgi:hypothetical protein